MIAYTAAVYGFLPFGPRIGLTLGRTALGSWLLGPGMLALTAAGAVGLVVLLARRGAPMWAYVLLVTAAGGYALAFSWLRGQHLERTHLPEYGIMAGLAWWALAPLLSGTVSPYVASAALAAVIGYGDELLQHVVPGRVYDIRDVAMNGAGAVLGTFVLAAARARTSPHTGAVRAGTARGDDVRGPSPPP